MQAQPELKSRFSNQLSSYQDQYSRKKTQYNQIATIRLIVLAGGIALSIYLLNDISGWWAILSLGLTLGIFIYLVKIHNRIRHDQNLLRKLIEINREEMKRMSDDWFEFDTGADYQDPDHPYTGDLDVFGQGSLFQYINRSATHEGHIELAQWLKEPADKDTISQRQAAIGELAQNPDHRQRFQAYGKLHESSPLNKNVLEKWLEETPAILSKPWLKGLIYTLPVFTILATFYSLFTFQWSVAGIFILVQLGISWMFKSSIQNHHVSITHFSNLFKQYGSLLPIIEGQEWQSQCLNQLTADLQSSNNQRAGETLHHFTKILDAFDTRLGMIVPLLLNGLIFWDLHCARRIEQWKAQHKKDVSRWFPVIGKWDALCSLAGFAELNPGFSYPKVSDKCLLEAKELSHPLLPIEGRVSNDVKLEEPGQFLLITGSNMAGKSTFLRTTGINQILAMSGAPVCASDFDFYPVRLCTSMRIGDSLRSGQSTFYAELSRLKMILETLHEKEEPVFILLDEILKGTNSEDKLQGSKAYIEQLINLKGTGLIATHDLALSNLEDQYPNNIFNYNFEVAMESGDFQYDYKLKRGVCQTMNASELMRSMGIIMN